LPPRLRDRLQASQEPEPKSSPIGAILGVVTLLLVVGAVWFLVAANKAKTAAAAKAAAAAAAAREAFTADSLRQVNTADSLLAAARADSVAAFMKLPKWRRDQLMGIATPGIDDPTQKGSFTIDAGSFLFEDPANAAVAAMKGKTTLEVRVVPVTDGGNTSYHVYVGKFSMRGAAQEAGDALLNKGVVNMANVVSLPK
jgi:hypothetical protein